MCMDERNYDQRKPEHTDLVPRLTTLEDAVSCQ